MKSELVCHESRSCPEALGQQSIKLSHQTERLSQIPLLNNGCHTHTVSSVMLCKKKKKGCSNGIRP